MRAPRCAARHAPRCGPSLRFATLAVALLGALQGACAGEGDPTIEHPTEVALIARQTLLWAHRVPGAPEGLDFPAIGFNVMFAPSPADLDCGETCVGESWVSPATGEWQVWVAEVAWMGQTRTANVYAMPVVHEFLHVLFRDERHADARLWGPQGIEGSIYRDLNCFPADGSAESAAMCGSETE